MTDVTAVRRRPDQGGYARGEETRARIVAAALQVFGAEGYARASTRQIATEAGVNPPALQYYFHSKEGLHRACAQFIIGEVSDALAPRLEAAQKITDADGPERAVAALGDILDGLVDVSLASTQGAGWRKFMARGQADGAGPAFPLIRDGISRPIHRACARLLGIAIGASADDEQTRLRTTLVLSQITALHINSENTLSIMGWDDFGGDRLSLVKALLRSHTVAAVLGKIDRPG